MEKWYNRIAENGDIVVSTRIRLARNLSSFPFEGQMTPSQQAELNTLVKAALQSEESVHTKWNFLSIQSLTSMERISLAERGLISRRFLEQPKNRMLALSEDEGLSIMVNEEDHIRLQSIVGGMDLSGAYAACDRLDDILDGKLIYAFDDRLGYLTASPTSLGTGLRASVMLHLPALERSNVIPQLMKTVGRLGLTIRGAYGEGTAIVGATYEMSNQVTMGLSEETAIRNLENVVQQVIASERALRKDVLQNNIEIIDEICRSYGVLKYARLLSSNEFYTHISNVRFGISERILDSVTLETVNALLNRVGAATVCAEENQELNPRERDLYRAKIVREAL